MESRRTTPAASAFTAPYIAACADPEDRRALARAGQVLMGRGDPGADPRSESGAASHRERLDAAAVELHALAGWLAEGPAIAELLARGEVEAAFLRHRGCLLARRLRGVAWAVDRALEEAESEAPGWAAGFQPEPSVDTGAEAEEILHGALDHFLAGCLQLEGLRDRVLERMVQDGDPLGGRETLVATLNLLLQRKARPLVEELMALTTLPDMEAADADEVGELQIWLAWKAAMLRRLGLHTCQQARVLAGQLPPEEVRERMAEGAQEPTLAVELAEMVAASTRRLAHLIVDLERCASARGRLGTPADSEAVERVAAELEAAAVEVGQEEKAL